MNRHCCFCGCDRGPWEILQPDKSSFEGEKLMAACRDVAACSCRMRRAGLTPRDSIEPETGRQMLEKVFRRRVSRMNELLG